MRQKYARTVLRSMKDGLFTIGFVAFLAFRQFSNYWVSTSVNSVEELEPDMPLLELKRSRFDEQALARLWEGLEKLCAAAPVPVELVCAPLERMRANVAGSARRRARRVRSPSGSAASSRRRRAGRSSSTAKADHGSPATTGGAFCRSTSTRSRTRQLMRSCSTA